MRTVETVLDQVYGGKKAAADALGAKKNAPWNWKKSGHFPARVAIQISHDAERKGVDLPLSEIPVMGTKGSAQ